MIRFTGAVTLTALLVLLIGVVSLGFIDWFAVPHPTCTADQVPDKVQTACISPSLHVPFIANRGQVDRQVALYARTFAGTVFVTRDGGIVYSLPAYANAEPALGLWPQQAGQDKMNSPAAPGSKPTQRVAVKEELVNKATAYVTGENQAATRINTFIGQDKARWVDNAPAYDVADCGEVYPGIRLQLKAFAGNVEKIFSVGAGADPAQIRVRVSGAETLQVTDAGELELNGAGGALTLSRPVAYQLNGNQRQDVPVSYAVDGHEYTFALGQFDPAYPLVIDPQIVSTFLGGSDRDGLFEVPIVRDMLGDIYVADRTISTDFPTTPGAYMDTNTVGDYDVFIARLSADLSVLLAATYLGGSGDDASWPGVDLRLDGSGNVYVAGKTASADFPRTAGAYDTTRNGAYDAFITKLDGNLSTLLASTLLGGSQSEYYVKILIDQDGTVLAIGTTGSSDFPTTVGAYDRTYAGGNPASPYPGDLFVSRLSGDLTTLLAGTYVGGAGDEYCEAAAFDATGNIYLTGWTGSTNYPTTLGAFQRTHYGGSYDAFVSKLSGNLASLPASTFIGGTSWDFGYGLTLNPAGNVYITGHTASPSFPISENNPFDPSYNGTGSPGVDDDCFVSKFNSGLTLLLSSTFLGGTGWENGQALATDQDGSLIIGGYTRSANFPSTPTAYDMASNGLEDVFISRMDADLLTLTASTYLGGSRRDFLGSMLLDEPGFVFAGGTTASTNFPTTVGVYQENHAGGLGGAAGDGMGGDAFIAKLDLDWAIKDSDGDGILNGVDNCPEVPNPGQEDADLDLFGDPCDNCPAMSNPDQVDINRNNIGDLCEVLETWYVQADGAGEAPTIQAAIDSSIHGDTVLVGPGTYTGPGNRDLDLNGRRIRLMAESGPATTILELGGTAEQPHRALLVHDGQDTSIVIDGFTFQGGFGGIYNGTSSGGAIVVDGSSPTVHNCVFAGNTATVGGAVYALRASPRFINCTFADNLADYGAALIASASGTLKFENCLVAFNGPGEGCSCFDAATTEFTCCDVYGNQGGNWVGCASGQQGVRGNFSADPLFCHRGSRDYGLRENSPCAPANNTCSVLIGARDAGCTCNCGVWGDVGGDGQINPIDVVCMVNKVYKGIDNRVQPPYCPKDAGDVNCDDSVNPLDVVRYVNFVYKGQTTWPCSDPCGP